MHRWILAFLLALPALPAHAGDAPPTEAARLVEGVRQIALPGVPGTVCAFGPDAFPVVEAPAAGGPVPLVAATHHGRGRAVLFGHGYFGDALEVGDTARLALNVLRWAGGEGEQTTVGVRGRFRPERHLDVDDITFLRLDGSDWTERLGDVDVVILALADVKASEEQALARRLREGLGLVAGMPGWGWKQLHPGQRLPEDNPANRLLAPAGLVWGDGTIRKPKSGVLEVRGPASATTHAGRALAVLEAGTEDGEVLAAAAASVTRAIRDVPRGDLLFRPRLDELARRVPAADLVPSKSHPLVARRDGLARVLLAWQLACARNLEATQVEAHPAAAVFPGPVPDDARRVERAVVVDTGVPRWHGTGLYAAPGDVVTLTLSEEAARAGLAVRVGAHVDRLWDKPSWSRVPAITSRVPLDATQVQVASPFGGLLYVDVPARAKRTTFELEVRGAVEAPRFVLGTTDPKAWRRSIREHPAPWAELETSKVILTLPSEHVRGLDDPTALLVWWDRVMDACADLATIPRERGSPERYVTDVQISAGYMHAGYPIMTHLDAAPRFVDLDRLSTQGDWGMFHEMGHNHQQRDWTFAGTGEVTVNLFSLYLMETVCSKGVGHPAMSPESIAKHTAAFRAGGSRFEAWKREPFTALIPYYQLEQAFGWEAYQRVFAEYRALPRAERPTNDAEKRDQWLVRMSKTVGRDLGPFFEAWSIPTSKAAREAVGDLPAWMPDTD